MFTVYTRFESDCSDNFVVIETWGLQHHYFSIKLCNAKTGPVFKNTCDLYEVNFKQFKAWAIDMGNRAGAHLNPKVCEDWKLEDEKHIVTGQLRTMFREVRKELEASGKSFKS
jgi:hypothetical protein